MAAPHNTKLTIQMMKNATYEDQRQHNPIRSLTRNLNETAHNQ